MRLDGFKAKLAMPGSVSLVDENRSPAFARLQSRQRLNNSHEMRAELNDVRERINTAKGVLDRVSVTAPVRGVVVKLRYHTPGGVVRVPANRSWKFFRSMLS